MVAGADASQVEGVLEGGSLPVLGEAGGTGLLAADEALVDGELDGLGQAGGIDPDSAILKAEVEGVGGLAPTLVDDRATDQEYVSESARREQT